MYLFFSSDIFDLYRKDIITGMSLPIGYAIHFRYPQHLLSDELRDGLLNLVGKDGIIIYVKGNDDIFEMDERKVSFLPIRDIRVLDVYINKSTSLVHFFLELGAFIKSNAVPIQTYPERNKLLPPYYFVHILPNWNSQICEWHEKVQELVEFDDRFKNLLFFHVNIKYNELLDHSDVHISYDRSESSSFFELQEDRQYSLDIAIYNSCDDHRQFEKYALKMDYESEDFFITNPEKVIIGANLDNRIFKVITKDIKSVKSSAYIKFQSISLGAIDIINHEMIVLVNIKRSMKKLRKFLFVSLMTFVGTVSVTLSMGQFNKVGGTGYAISLLIFGLVSFLVSSLMQFYFFNKRG